MIKRARSVRESPPQEPPVFSVLVEAGGYECLNVGDMAMLEVAVRRLHELWPDACIRVLTDAPERLLARCPKVHPVPAAGRRVWFGSGFLLGAGERFLPGLAVHRVHGLERRLRRSLPRLTGLILRARCRRGRRDTTDLTEFLSALRGAGLLVVSGAGGMNDAFTDHALTVLEMLEFAARRGTPTAMLGQGIGPINGPGLRRRASQVLKSVDLIALREDRAGRPLLEEIGVSPDRIVTTGDDAVEIAHQGLAADVAGAGLGVNVRASTYAGVSDDLVDELRRQIGRVGALVDAPLVRLPVAHHEADSDVRALDRLLGESDHAGPSAGPLTSTAFAELVGQCRAIVTGSYHAAVFALSQGIPVVALAGSRYYVDKFAGLADQFGGGVMIIRFDDPNWTDLFGEAVDHAWVLPADARQSLRDAATRQVAAGTSAYHLLPALVTPHPPSLGSIRRQRPAGRSDARSPS
ncbi:MAG: polysaccharide pyruvyl transferase family protein [Acidimicrobiales bacterium]